MSTAGEAAALFGSPDSAADPFAVVLGGDEVPTPARPNGDAKPTSTASDFFANATDSSDLFAAEETALTHGTLDYDRQNTWCDASTQQNYTYDTAAVPTYAPTSSEYASQNHMNGWYDQYGQGMTHEISQSSEYTHYDSQPQATLHQSYGSYAPAVPDYNAAPPVSERTQNPTYTAYDPYKPAMQTTPNYTPAYNAHPPAQSSYDPYKPTAHTAPPPPDPVHAQTHHSYAGEPSSTWTRSSPAMIAPLLPRPPSPPGPSVASFRPKTMNAYDPPLPPMPAPRHISGSPWHTHHAAPLVSPLSQQSYEYSRLGAAVNHDEWASQEYSTGGRDHTIDDGYERSYDANRQYQAIPGERRDVSNSMYHASPVANYSDASTHVTDTMSPVMHAQQPARDMEDPMLGMAFVHPDEEDGVITSAPVTGSTSSPRLSAQTWGHVESLAVVPFNLTGNVCEESSEITCLPAAQASNLPKLPPASPYTPASTLSPPKETIPLATATSPYEPYKPNGASPHEPPHPPHNYALPDPNQATSVPPSFDAPVTSTQGSFNGSAHGSVSHSPERTKSPGSSSVRSVASIPRQSYDPPAKSFATTHSERTKSPGGSSIRSIPSVQRQTYDPPARKYSTSATMSPSAIPQTISDAKRTSSPAQSIRSVNGPVTTTYDPYTPAEKHVATSSPHTRSTSTGSTSSTSVVRDDRYAPPRQVTQLVSERSRGTFSTPSQPLDVYAASSLPLASTNDPLGRTSVRVPVISFGSGGKLVTCFHGASMNTGFDVALSSRQSTDIKMYVLHQIIPESALETSAASYPGPLFSDPGTPTTSLVRSGTATQLKTKKARVVKYLEERSDEMSQGIGYHHPGSLERKRADAKRILVMLLKVMVENDGRLSGSPQIDAAVRGALIPRLDGTSSPPDALKNVSA
ncbi:hypothetical protein A0H81_04207 [Grifola frondosa]|uniref:Sec16 central conserved domain-containing protein n=1 Tax=Grifola frondosa TaxID=5627 RepID=A0A1C7MF99_GRIFR|nr:hypothetical protein A0H81_04207 [Grifola frondosa]